MMQPQEKAWRKEQLRELSACNLHRLVDKNQILEEIQKTSDGTQMSLTGNLGEEVVTWLVHSAKLLL